MAAHKDVSALNGTLNAPPAYGGQGAPVEADYGNAPSVAVSGNSKSRPVSTASDAAVKTLHLAAAIIILILALLWVFGGIVFKNANI